MPDINNRLTASSNVNNALMVRCAICRFRGGHLQRSKFTCGGCKYTVFFHVIAPPDEWYDLASTAKELMPTCLVCRDQMFLRNLHIEEMKHGGETFRFTFLQFHCSPAQHSIITYPSVIVTENVFPMKAISYC